MGRRPRRRSSNRAGAATVTVPSWAAGLVVRSRVRVRRDNAYRGGQDGQVYEIRSRGPSFVSGVALIFDSNTPPRAGAAYEWFPWDELEGSGREAFG